MFQSDGCLTSPSPLSPSVRRSLDEFPLGRPGSIRRLQRTLSEDSRRRRESLPSTPISLPTNIGSINSHSGLGHSKCTPLLVEGIYKNVPENVLQTIHSNLHHWDGYNLLDPY